MDNSQKGLIHILIPLIILVGIVATVWLVTSGSLKLFPKASAPKPTDPETSFSLVGPDEPQPGEEFEVKLYVRSDIDEANLFQAKMKFPANLVDVTGIKTDNGFIKNWVENFYDNNTGEISLAGGVPAPGFQTKFGGESALMSTIVFKAKAKGEATIAFTNESQILRNTDNTNILNIKRDLSINIAGEQSVGVYNLGVLVIKYFPLTADGKNIDITITGDIDWPYSDVRQRTIDITKRLKDSLEKASKYLGHKDSSVISSLTYTIVDTKEYTKAVPLDPVTRRPLYKEIMLDHNICDLVDNKNVREVWLWAYQGPTYQGSQYPYLNISESKMAGPFGDISNSYRLNDMPVCKRSYRVYTFNYQRGTPEAMESWGHQMEAELDVVNRDVFRNKFQGVPYPQTANVNGRCGSVHNPPNARSEYDRSNTKSQKSDCLDWNVDNLGQPSDISCENWSSGCKDNGDGDNPSLNYMIWNWQNLPGLNNNKSYQGKKFRNLWDIHGKFDEVMGQDKTFFTSQTPTSTPTPTPAPPVSQKGDGNKDGKINLVDLSVLLSDFNKEQGFREPIDMDDNKKINTFDYSLHRKLLIETGVIKGQ